MIYLILDNIRSAHNVGAIFRTADGAGVAHIYLTGITPSPIDRFGRPVPEIEKTALGATASVPYSTMTLQDAITEVIDRGATLVAVEQDARSTMLANFIPPTCVAYVVGNEVTGVSKEVLAKAAMIVALPQYGIKESLNVSVCTGIILYHTVVEEARGSIT